MTPWPDLREVWDFSDPAVSETRFRQLAAEAESAGDDVFSAEALSQVARTFSLRNQFGDANDLLDAVEAMSAAHHPRVAVRLLLERGRNFNSSGDAEAALVLFESAVPIAAEAGEHFLAGDAMHMAAIAADIAGEERWLQRLSDYIAREPHDGSRYWLGPMHNNLGWSYFFADQLDDAAAQFRLSGIAYAATPDKHMETLIADYALGRVLRVQGNCAEALVLQESAFRAIAAEFDVQDEYLAEEAALCAAELGDRDRAKAWAQIAYASFAAQDWFMESEADRLEALRVLSED